MNEINVNSPTVSIAPTSSSQRVLLPSNSTGNFMVTNGSSATCFIKTGDITVTADTGSTPVLAGSIQEFTKQTTHTYIAAISTGSPTGSIYFTAGEK